MKLDAVFDFKFVKITIYTKVWLPNWFRKALWNSDAELNILIATLKLQKDSEILNSSSEHNLFSIVH